MYRTSTLAMAAATLAPIALAQERADPIAILRATERALQSAPAIAFEARIHGSGALASTTRAFSGDVVFAPAPADAALGYHLHIAGRETTTEGSRDILVAYDGVSARSVRYDHDKVVSAEPAVASQALGDAGIAYLWLHWWSRGIAAQLAENAELIPATSFGQAIVDGVRCEVVHIDCTNLPNFRNEYDLWWYLGADDHLPRRLEASSYVEDLLGFVVLDLIGPKRLGASAAGTFTIADLEGMELERLADEAPNRRPAAPAGPKAGDLAPEWTLKDGQGVDHSLADFRGKIVLLDFWATWCPPCKEAMPGMQRLHDRFAKRGVEVIGLNCWESGDAAGYMARNGLNYRLLLKADEVANAYAVSGIPTFYIIDEDGRVIERHVGFAPEAEEKLGEMIEARLKAAGR